MIHLPCDTVVTLFGIYITEMKIYAQMKICNMSLNSKFIWNSQKTEDNTNVLQWVNGVKEMETSTHGGTISEAKKKQPTDICNKLDGSQGHYALREKIKADLKILHIAWLHSWNDKIIIKIKNRYMMARKQNWGMIMIIKRSYIKNFLCNDETVLYHYCNVTKIYTWDQVTEN